MSADAHKTWATPIPVVMLLLLTWIPRSRRSCV